LELKNKLYQRINELIDEISLSKNSLEKNLNIKVNCFSYPFGNNQSIDASAYKIITNSYDYCFTGLRGLNTSSVDPNYLFRDKIEVQSGNKFNQNIIEGMMDWFYWFKMINLKRRTKA
jgi:hypothetical protein